MQTFVPYADTYLSALVLDRQRLGKQRVEVLQILHVLSGQSSGWKNHPAVRMWHGAEGFLQAYGDAVCWEWKHRGYKDTCRGKIMSLSFPTSSQRAPEWWNGQIHSSHRSNLLRKAPEWYGNFGWKEQDNLPYVWPIKQGDHQ